MNFQVGIENNNEGFRSVAWALDYPGCYAYGKNADESLAHLPAAIRAYSNWISQFGDTWVRTENIDLDVSEVWNNYHINEQFDRIPPNENAYLVDSWFQHDWKPLTGLDIERALKLLSWSRAALFDTIKGLEAEKLDQTYPGERWSINGILKHVGGAEWWYMDRLGRAFPQGEVPKAPLERLEKVRAAFVELLPKLEGVKCVMGVDGEFWSPRKVLRRALWHERDHTDHIRKLV
jgi:hypothetical protein